MSPETVMIMAGGTGGHVYPALAVARFLKAQGQTVRWLGTQTGLESRVVPENGFNLNTVNIVGLRGHGLLRLCLSPLLVIRAVIESIRILRRERPSVVLGMGGFVSGPGGLAAWLCRIPLCIHEQNAIAGLTNRLLKPFARVVLQAFPGAFVPGPRVVTSGNPVREEILAVAAPEQRMHMDKPRINLLIIGGSLGALKLNQVVPAALAVLSRDLAFEVRHQTGTRHLDLTRERYADCGVKAEVIDYIEDMAAVYAWADLVVCRAGAMTIAELAAVGVGSILVPFPFAVDDHQTANARYLADAGCAVLLPETELTAERLATALRELCASRERLLSMARTCRGLARPGATAEVARYCLEVARA